MQCAIMRPLDDPESEQDFGPANSLTSRHVMEHGSDGPIKFLELDRQRMLMNRPSLRLQEVTETWVWQLCQARSARGLEEI
jgi:hypothetical protein